MFLDILPDEEFIDRRINMSLLVEPESDSDNKENEQLLDQYDNQGKLMKSFNSSQ